jgi:hypothetical protein
LGDDGVYAFNGEGMDVRLDVVDHGSSLTFAFYGKRHGTYRTLDSIFERRSDTALDHELPTETGYFFQWGLFGTAQKATSGGNTALGR